MSEQMQVTETLSDGLKRAYTVVVPTAAIEEQRTRKLGELAKSMKLPGFRPGKVPVSVVRQRYGQAVMSEVLEQSVNDAARQTLSDRGLRSAGQPKVEIVSAEPGKDLEFKVEVELLPEIELPDLAAIELTRLKAEPADDTVAKTLAQIASRQRDLVPVEEDRGAERGETLTVDFLGRIDDVAFEGGTAQDVPVELGGAGFIPGFSEGMEGMKPGETRDVPVTFPAEYQAKELAGKNAVFTITAKSLQRPVDAEINDGFATKLGFESLDKLRDAIREQMQREYDGLARTRVKRQLLDILAERATFEAPASMVQAEFDAIWRRVETDLKAGKGDEDDAGKDEETLKGEYRAIADRRVRLGLLLAEVGRRNNVQVGADEMSRAMRTEAARYQGQEAQVMEFFRKNPQAAESLRGPLFEDKVVDFILDQARITDQVVTAEELVAEPAPTTSEAA